MKAKQNQPPPNAKIWPRGCGDDVLDREVGEVLERRGQAVVDGHGDGGDGGSGRGGPIAIDVA